MNLSKVLLLLTSLLIGAYFVNHYTKTNEYLEHGNLVQIPIKYQSLEAGNFIVYTLGGTIKTYLKVVGVSTEGQPIVQYGDNIQKLTELAGPHINDLNSSYNAGNRYGSQLIKDEDYWANNLDVLTEAKYNELKSQYFADSYRFDRFQFRNKSNFLNVITQSPFSYGILVAIAMLLIFVIRSASRWVNILVPNRWHDVPLLILLLPLHRYILAGWNPFIFDTMLAGLVVTTSIAVPLFLLYKWLWPKVNHLSFGTKQILIFTIIIFLGNLYFFAYMYTIVNAVGDRFPTIPEQFSDKIFLFLRNPLPFYLASAVFFLNVIREFVRLKRTSNKALASEIQATRANSELESMQARVNPHFLYNALNSIASLATVAPEKTQEMAIALSQFYRYSTNRKDATHHTLADEVDLIRSYMSVEKVRFGEKLRFDVDIDPSLLTIQIPRFLIQPLIENSVKYGYSSDKECTDIKLCVEQEASALYIRVYDSGPSFEESLDFGYGISSIDKKLRLTFGPTSELSFINSPLKHVQLKVSLKDV